MTDIPRKWERKLHAEPALCPAEEGGGIWLQGAEIDAFNVSVIQHTEVHLGFSAGALCSCRLPGPLHRPPGPIYPGTASALTWMAPGGVVEEARTRSHCMCSQLAKREWSHLCKTWLRPSLQSSLPVQEGWQTTGTATQSISETSSFRAWGGSVLIRVSSPMPYSCPPTCSPRGPNSGTYVGHMTEHSVTAKNGKTALRREICCSCCMELGWEGVKGVRERSGAKSKCQHYLELANCWRDYRGICRMIVPGWMLRTSGSIVILAVSREARVMPPGWALTENPPDICEWVHSFKNTFLPSNAPHIRHPGHIIDVVFALTAKPSAYCCSLC